MTERSTLDRILSFADCYRTSLGLVKLQPEESVEEYPARFLAHAASELTSEEQKKFFSPKNLGPLLRRLLAADYLFDSDTPFFGLSDFARHARLLTRDFARYRKFVVKTGLRVKSLSDYRWLSEKLGCLYPTRQTSPTYFVDFPSDTIRAERYYQWINPPRGPHLLIKATAPVPFEEAAFLELLDPERGDVEFIEKRRDTFLDMKTAVIDTLADIAVTSSRPSDLWKAVSGAFFNDSTFSGDEFLGFLQIDRRYFHQTSNPPEIARWNDRNFEKSPGGLTNLLLITTHILCECKYAAYTTAYESLHKLKSKVKQHREQCETRPRSAYFVLAASINKNRVDRTLDKFVQQIHEQRLEEHRLMAQINVDLRSRFQWAADIPILHGGMLPIPDLLEQYITWSHGGETVKSSVGPGETRSTKNGNPNVTDSDSQDQGNQRTSSPYEKPLGDVAREMLRVLYDKLANSPAKACKKQAIATRIITDKYPTATADIRKARIKQKYHALARPVRLLLERHFICSREGRSGGYWLTIEGIEAHENEMRQVTKSLQQKLSSSGSER